GDRGTCGRDGSVRAAAGGEAQVRWTPSKSSSGVRDVWRLHDLRNGLRVQKTQLDRWDTERSRFTSGDLAAPGQRDIHSLRGLELGRSRTWSGPEVERWEHDPLGPEGDVSVLADRRRQRKLGENLLLRLPEEQEPCLARAGHRTTLDDKRALIALPHV